MASREWFLRLIPRPETLAKTTDVPAFQRLEGEPETLTVEYLNALEAEADGLARLLEIALAA